MAETLQALSTENTSEKASSTTKKGRPERASREKTARKSGAERLRQAADRRVGRNSKKLADLLTEKALKGDLASTKVLVGLAERKKPSQEPAKKRRGPSLAEQLAAEPQWVEEQED
jgi:hypothetical protein